MANNKVVYYGSTLIDLTGDTVTAGDVLAGKTFHTKAGTKTTGTLEPTGATWTITGVVGATVTVTGNSKTYTKTIPSSGKVEFKGLTAGTWTAKMSKTGETTVTMTRKISTNYSDTMSFKGVPEFTYTGTYENVDDNDNPISSPTTWKGNWKIRFLTSGTLRFTNLRGYTSIDVFLVGGGGGAAGSTYGRGVGGGGGYTSTALHVAVEINVDYQIEVGAGGVGGANTVTNGGTSSAFDSYAAGGIGGVRGGKPDGGSGGGRGTNVISAGAGKGGSDGSDGGKSDEGAGGTGQGTTTREFGDTNGKLYSGGGGGASTQGGPGGNGGEGGGGNGYGTNHAASDGAANTGGGAGAGPQGSANGKHGGSGIVIIRNAREAA